MRQFRMFVAIGVLVAVGMTVSAQDTGVKFTVRSARSGKWSDANMWTEKRVPKAGDYHPDYDAHVYRNIYLNRVDAEPIDRGHDDESIQYGSFTYENLTIENCRVGRDPLIQLTCTSPPLDKPDTFAIS